MNLFWIPFKTLNFSNQCSVVKTHERDNWPTSPSKTVKLSFINQKKEQIWILWRYLLCSLTLAYITFGLSACCVRLPQVDVNHRWLCLTSSECHSESPLILCKNLQRNLTKVVLAEPTLVIAWKQHKAQLVQMAVKEFEQSWMQLARDSMTYDMSRKPLITLNI